MSSIILQPIAFVKNSRQEISDDNWGNVISEVIFHDGISEDALAGIDEFSHLEIIFYMDQVSYEKAIPQLRNPRGDTSLPKVGIFAQRNKNRPNKIGLTTVEFIEKKGKSIFVKGLDAIDGTPVLDVKPVMVEFEPKGEIKQAAWTKVIMKDYWNQ